MVNLRGVLSLGDVGGVAVLVASPLHRVSGNVRCADRTLDVIQVVGTTMGRGVVKVDGSEGVVLAVGVGKDTQEARAELGERAGMLTNDHTC